MSECATWRGIAPDVIRVQANGRHGSAKVVFLVALLSPEVWSVPLASPAGMSGLAAGRLAREGGPDGTSTRAASLAPGSTAGCASHPRGREGGPHEGAPPTPKTPPPGPPAPPLPPDTVIPHTA